MPVSVLSGSIAPITVLALTSMLCTGAQASDTRELPPLGNTSSQDRIMLREITDQHVHDGVTRPAKTPVKPASTRARSSVPEAETPLGSEAETEKTTVSIKSQPLSDNVWDHIRQSDRFPLHSSERIDFYKDQYRREALWISKILHRGRPFLAHLVQSLEQRFLPVELALLPAIESGFQPLALSAGRAAGLWQIVPITAKEIGISRDQWFDGRTDIVRSTTAALDYLSYLNAEFNGDWELTLAAYNAGPGRVRSAIRKNRKAGLALDYWSLPLPQETRNYVPKFVALLALLKDPEFDDFDMPEITMSPTFEPVDVGFRISVDKAAAISGLDEKQLRLLNAGLTHAVTPPGGPHKLMVPAGNAEKFREALAKADRKSMYSEPRTHEVVAGDTVSGIAQLYGISQRRLLSMNGLDNSRIRIGQKLAVIDTKNSGSSNIEYVVAIGDTLSDIAQKFSVDVRDIKQVDGSELDDDIIHPGELLSIVVNLAGNG